MQHFFKDGGTERCNSGLPDYTASRQRLLFHVSSSTTTSSPCVHSGSSLSRSAFQFFKAAVTTFFVSCEPKFEIWCGLTSCPDDLLHQPALTNLSNMSQTLCRACLHARTLLPTQRQLYRSTGPRQIHTFSKLRIPCSGRGDFSRSICSAAASAEGKCIEGHGMQGHCAALHLTCEV